MPSRLSDRAILIALAWLSSLLAIGSLALAILKTMGRIHFSHVAGLCLIAAWMFLPPVWFGPGKDFLCLNMSDADRERVKQHHQIARGIWLALLVTLVFLLGGGGLSFHL